VFRSGDKEIRSGFKTRSRRGDEAEGLEVSGKSAPYVGGCISIGKPLLRDFLMGGKENGEGSAFADFADDIEKAAVALHNALNS
jgi:hypothetical protein